MDPGMEHAISALRMPSRIGGPPERRWPALKTRLSARIHVRAGTLEPRTSNKKQVWPNRSVLERFSYSSSASIAFLFTRTVLRLVCPFGLVPPTFLCQII